MIFNELRAPKCRSFRKSGRAARNEVRRLIVAEAREDGFFAGKIVVEADIPCAFVKLPVRHEGVVELQGGIVRVGNGIKAKHSSTYRVNEGRRNYVAGRAACLYAAAVGHN